MGQLRKFLIRVILLAAILVLGFGYLGFIPGVSAVLKSNRPVDLGLPATEDDRLSANQKFHQTMLDAGTLRGRDVIREGGTQPVDATFTPQEAAAHLMQMHPFTDLQIRFNPDGTFEAAGKVDTPRITGYLKALDLTSVKGIDVIKTIDRYLIGQPTIYLKGAGSITEDASAVHLTAARIGRLPLAAGAFGKGISSYVDAVMRTIPSLEVQSLGIENGQAHFVGTVPAVIPKY